MKNNIINFFKRIANSKMEFDPVKKKYEIQLFYTLLYFSFICGGLWVQVIFDTAKLIVRCVIMILALSFLPYSNLLPAKRCLYYYVSYYRGSGIYV